MNSLWLWVCTCINTYLCVCDYTLLTEASMVEDNTQQEKPKNKFSSELRLFLLMPNVESILWILLLLFITVGQFFIKFFFLNVLLFQSNRNVLIKLLADYFEHIVRIDLNRWLNDSQKTFMFLYNVPILLYPEDENRTLMLKRSRLNRDYD